MTMRDAIRATFNERADQPAIQYGGAWTNWRRLGLLADGLQSAFEQAGLTEGAAIACALRNRPDHAAAMMGVVASGRCLVTLNALSPDLRLTADIVAARAPVLLATAEDWARPALRDAAATLGALGLCIDLERDAGVMPVSGLDAVGAGPHQPPLPGVAILMLTSGTTGTPKRVPLRADVLERQLVDAGAARAPIAGETIGPSLMSQSVVHIGGVWGVLGAAMSGRPFRLTERFSVAEWVAAIVELRPKASGAPPAALRMILDANVPREDLSSLVMLGAGTSPLDPAIVDEFLARYDLPVLSNYGATEFAGGVASWSLPMLRKYWTAKRGAAGRIHKSMEARVVDPATGDVLPAGIEGILELRGFAAGDGVNWIRTTDRAVLDDDRFLWIRGRADNAIIRGGFKVHPDDIVAALEAHPAVREAAVVGLPDRRLGQVPGAAVILRSSAEPPGEGELAEWVRARLIAYCVPAVIRIVDDFPRTPSMKPSGPEIVALLAPADTSS